MFVNANMLLHILFQFDSSCHFDSIFPMV